MSNCHICGSFTQVIAKEGGGFREYCIINNHTVREW